MMPVFLSALVLWDRVRFPRPVTVGFFLLVAVGFGEVSYPVFEGDGGAETED